jgi:hypothetical protein
MASAVITAASGCGCLTAEQGAAYAIGYQAAEAAAAKAAAVAGAEGRKCCTPPLSPTTPLPPPSPHTLLWTSDAVDAAAAPSGIHGLELTRLNSERAFQGLCSALDRDEWLRPLRAVAQFPCTALATTVHLGVAMA